MTYIKKLIILSMIYYIHVSYCVIFHLFQSTAQAITSSQLAAALAAATGGPTQVKYYFLSLLEIHYTVYMSPTVSYLIYHLPC
jgi:hypothetical protein